MCGQREMTICTQTIANIIYSIMNCYFVFLNKLSSPQLCQGRQSLPKMSPWDALKKSQIPFCCLSNSVNLLKKHSKSILVNCSS